jgi:16S rRNA (guanine966-N2)-methyltransferase
LRIIGGKYSGKIVKDPKGFNSRITTDMAKEALFNMLDSNFYFDSLTVVDMFGGSGNISYEFLSRGVAKLYVIEKDYKNFRFISSNIKQFAEKERFSLIKGDSFKKIPNLVAEGVKADIVFADPPFAANFIHTIPDFIFDSGILKDEGWLILEHDKRNDFSAHKLLRDKRKYGGVLFSIFYK